MDEKTARKYRDSEGLPSERVASRTWRTREDPFAEVWPEVQARLEAEPRLRAYTLFGWLQDRYPGQFSESQRRTLERRVRAWRGGHGPNREVMFPQIHRPGELAASDFTCMNELKISIAGQSFDHMVYHFTLTHSNWESVTVCFSESFEAFSRGFQEALWKLGGVPCKHRSDSFSAAVNNLSEDREFRGRYRDLLAYYQMEPQRINVRKAHENGDVESSHGHFKDAVDQALLLRGSRDFASREEYAQFLEELVEKRNQQRSAEWTPEQACLSDLPPKKLDHRQRMSKVKVHSSSTIQVKRNTYSVPSRLIGHRVDVVIDVDSVAVWYQDRLVQEMPRLRGSGKHAINYRHVIDSLVRKPGAFANYKYHADMFPTSHFRMAYDSLVHDRGEHAAAREYLKILQLAARDSQDAVHDALRQAIDANAPITAKSIGAAVEKYQQPAPVTDIEVEAPDLKDFDSLLQHPDMEVLTHDYVNETCEPAQGPSRKNETSCNLTAGNNPSAVDDEGTDRTVSGTASADVSGALRESGSESGGGIAQSHGLSVGVDEPGMPSAPGEPHRPPDATVSVADVENVGEFRLEATPVASGSPDGNASRGIVSGSRENLLVFGKPGAGKSHVLCALGEQLVQRSRSVYFTTCSLLVQELLIAKRDLRLPRLLKKLSRYEGLIIDDLGYVQQNREEMEVLFTLLAERYERGSVLLTSNLPFSKWEQIFKDAMTTAAAINRLVHHSVILELNVPSYRLEKATKPGENQSKSSKKS